MNLNQNDYHKYIEPKDFENEIICLHDAIIERICIDKDKMTIEVDASEWEGCRYKLAFLNVSSLHFSTGSELPTPCDGSMLFKLDILTYICFFNLIRFKNDFYFYFFWR